MFAGLAGRRWCEDCEAERKQFKEMDDRAPLRTLYNSSCLHCVYVMPALCYAINYRTLFALRVRGRFPGSAHTARTRSSHIELQFSNPSEWVRLQYSNTAPSTVSCQSRPVFFGSFVFERIRILSNLNVAYNEVCKSYLIYVK